MKIYRRSIFASSNIKKGEKFTKNNIKVIRPGHGLHPKYFNAIINKKSPQNLKFADPLSPKILKLLKI